MNNCLIVVIAVFFIRNAFGNDDAWSNENIHIKCPQQCVCQYLHFMDLSISRWINHMNSKNHPNKVENKEEDLINDNEALFDGDESYLMNPIIKQATCILQTETNPKNLFEKLPHDIQSLVILYSENGKNKSVSTSYLKPLNQLSTLEIRGPSDKSLKLLIDEPLSFLQNANFESIQLEGSELLKRPKNPIHPSESFDYVPDSEKLDTYNVSLEIEDEIKILPYEVYIMEKKKSKMPSFYNWKHLEVLRIFRCKLDELHWEMFDGLSELQHLSLEENDIKIIPAFALYGAMHIKTLSLARNSILDLHYRSLAGLLDLEVLNLSHNNLTKLSEITFPPFPKLEMIDFRYNPIAYIFPATFGVMNMTRIMFLGSDEMELELTGNNPFESLELLKQLTISNISIKSLDQNAFKSLKSLEILNLKGYIGRIEFDAFVGMQDLKELNLSKCGIREISMDSFIGCTNLEIIDLSNNRLTYIPPGLFDDQLKLSEIYLNDNQLRFLPSNFFVSPSLKLARLTGNIWKCTCDMVVWDKKITNQERGQQQERCIKEFHSGKVISCRKIDNYKFNNKLSPRCVNIKNRSIYYALRHDLQCNFKKGVNKRMKFNNKQNGRQHLANRKERKIERQKNRQGLKNKLELDSNGNKRQKWEQNYLEKVKRTMEHMNSIQQLSLQNNAFLENDDNVSVLGRIDEHEQFNNI